jgi:hypothetical protein
MPRMQSSFFEWETRQGSYVVIVLLFLSVKESVKGTLVQKVPDITVPSACVVCVCVSPMESLISCLVTTVQFAPESINAVLFVCIAGLRFLPLCYSQPGMKKREFSECLFNVQMSL